MTDPAVVDVWPLALLTFAWLVLARAFLDVLALLKDLRRER